MRRNGGLSPKPKSRKMARTSIDMCTQTENFMVEEDITKLPVVLLDKSTITKYIQRRNQQERKDQSQTDGNSSRNIGKIITTTNYSTFLKPITNNQYANSTFDSHKTSKSGATIQKKSKRRVKFFRPNSIKPRKESLLEQEVDLRIRDEPCDSIELEPIPERTEVEQLNDTVLENEEEEEENHQSVGIGSLNVCEMSLNAEIQELFPNVEECRVNEVENIITGFSTKGTSTENSNPTEAVEKSGCFKINANSVTIYNHFY